MGDHSHDRSWLSEVRLDQVKVGFFIYINLILQFCAENLRLTYSFMANIKQQILMVMINYDDEDWLNQEKVGFLGDIKWTLWFYPESFRLISLFMATL